MANKLNLMAKFQITRWHEHNDESCADELGFTPTLEDALEHIKTVEHSLKPYVNIVVSCEGEHWKYDRKLKQLTKQ